MSLFRNAYYWFCLLFAISVLGFWRSYFSQFGEGTVHITHHAHGLSMLLWVAMLIIQSWLVRNRRNPMHRALGKVSFLLAPAVVVSAIWVNFHFVAGLEGPYPDGLISIFWFGFFLAMAFGVLYVLAILNRRRIQLHARYMVATGLVFIVPGLGRALDNYLEPLIGWSPSFFQVTLVPLLIGVWLLFLDWRRGKNLTPFLVFNGLWIANLIIWILSPRMGVWHRFAAWSAGL
jgi:hypothetical protein